jgi:hypothetical protein
MIFSDWAVADWQVCGRPQTSTTKLSKKISTTGTVEGQKVSTTPSPPKLLHWKLRNCHFSEPSKKNTQMSHKSIPGKLFYFITSKQVTISQLECRTVEARSVGTLVSQALALLLIGSLSNAVFSICDGIKNWKLVKLFARFFISSTR